VQRSSETIGTIAAALAKAQADSIGGPWRGRTLIPLCPPVERLGDRAQDVEPT
jgi:hypothetical protein